MKLKSLLKLSVLMLVVGFSLSAHSARAATWDPGRIIDDGVFTNKDAMSVQDIQVFLNSKVPTCDTSHTAGQYAYGAIPPWTCLKSYYENENTGANNLNGNPVPLGAISAAQIIYNYSQQYSINPRVLLVTLQKENGLITDTWPYPWQYRTAMGFACPDTAACDPSFYGFAKQVMQAARHFRNFYDENPNWTVPYKVGARYIQYNPDVSCGGSSVNIVTHGTAALYNYTPYQPNAAALAAGYGTAACGAYGNRNFWLYYTDWFGSTLFPQPNGGSLYQQQSTGQLFLVTDSIRYSIPDWNMMINYGLDTFPALPASDATIQGFADGGMLTSLIWDSGGVYLVNNQARQPVPIAMCATWNLACSDGTVTKNLGATFQTKYLMQGGNLTSLMKNGGEEYLMKNGIKSPIANFQTLSDLGYASTPAITASITNASMPLGALQITTPSVLKFSPNPTIYYFDGTNYLSVGDMDIYNDWALWKAPALKVPISSYNGTETPASTALTAWYQDKAGQKYIVDQGRKLIITQSLIGTFQSESFSTKADNLSALPTLSTLQQFIGVSPAIYMLSSGKKHYIPSAQDLSGLGVNNSNITGLRPIKLANVPQGSDALATGKLIKLTNSDAIFAVSGNSLEKINDVSTFEAYGFSWGSVVGYSASSMSDFALAPNPLTRMYSDATNGAYSYIIDGQTIRLTVQQASDYGLLVSKYQPIDAETTKLLPLATKQATRFYRNRDNGAIYYASGGAIHYVGSQQSFAAYGGTATQITPADSSFIQSFTIAQPI